MSDSTRILVPDHKGASAFSRFGSLPSLNLPDSSADVLVQRIADLGRARQLNPDADEETSDMGSGGVAPDEWLQIDCDESGCKGCTDVDLIAADAATDLPTLRTVLTARGWTSDNEGRDFCPRHRR